ncbi:hypothetical protein QR680_009770 [Steinernema hermaphroditum]|uniref:Uncharacterized protein n=1 Tax=Steinernema hermaphroditum TaxID=289476 RepID=A0AA39INB5_9BILA|nr:hypothetical protein QR680_009770 [Steinernema hermaphroditum]
MEKSSKNEGTRLGQKLEPADDHLVDGSDSGDLKRTWKPADDHLVDGSDNGDLFEKKMRRNESHIEDCMADERTSENDSSLDIEQVEVENYNAGHRVDDQEFRNRTRIRLRQLISEGRKYRKENFESECAELSLDYVEFLAKCIDGDAGCKQCPDHSIACRFCTMRCTFVRALATSSKRCKNSVPKRTCEQDNCFNFRHYVYRDEPMASLLDVWQFITEKKKKSMPPEMLHKLQLLAQLIHWDYPISEGTCDTLRKIASYEMNKCFYDEKIVADLPSYTFNLMAATCMEDLRFLRINPTSMGRWCRRSRKACLNFQHWGFPQHVFLNAFTPDRKDEFVKQITDKMLSRISARARADKEVQENAFFLASHMTESVPYVWRGQLNSIIATIEDANNVDCSLASIDDKPTLCVNVNHLFLKPPSPITPTMLSSRISTVSNIPHMAQNTSPTSQNQLACCKLPEDFDEDWNYEDIWNYVQREPRYPQQMRTERFKDVLRSLQKLRDEQQNTDRFERSTWNRAIIVKPEHVDHIEQVVNDKKPLDELGKGALKSRKHLVNILCSLHVFQEESIIENGIACARKQGMSLIKQEQFYIERAKRIFRNIMDNVLSSFNTKYGFSNLLTYDQITKYSHISEVRRQLFNFIMFLACCEDTDVVKLDDDDVIAQLLCTYITFFEVERNRMTRALQYTIDLARNKDSATDEELDGAELSVFCITMNPSHLEKALAHKMSGTCRAKKDKTIGTWPLSDDDVRIAVSRLFLENEDGMVMNLHDLSKLLFILFSNYTGLRISSLIAKPGNGSGILLKDLKFGTSPKGIPQCKVNIIFTKGSGRSSASVQQAIVLLDSDDQQFNMYRLLIIFLHLRGVLATVDQPSLIEGCGHLPLFARFDENGALVQEGKQLTEVCVANIMGEIADALGVDGIRVTHRSFRYGFAAELFLKTLRKKPHATWNEIMEICKSTLNWDSEPRTYLDYGQQELKSCWQRHLNEVKTNRSVDPIDHLTLVSDLGRSVNIVAKNDPLILMMSRFLNDVPDVTNNAIRNGINSFVVENVHHIIPRQENPQEAMDSIIALVACRVKGEQEEKKLDKETSETTAKARRRRLLFGFFSSCLNF